MSADRSRNQKNISFERQAQLAAQINSNSEAESRKALEELSQSQSNDSARALISAYRDCHWRNTRLQILKALGRNASTRAIDFLLRVTSNEDIGLAQEALLALGETQDPIAATFLLQRLGSAPLYLKPGIVNALAKVPELRAAPALKSLISSQECSEHPQLLRNCIMALAEMKDTSILPQLIEMLRNRLQNSESPPDATALTILSSIAKLSRNPTDLDEFERAFEGEMLHQQFFQQSRTQISFRHQWTLEDYLSKIFFAEHVQRSLPLELNSFPSQDITEALSLFATDEKHFQRLCCVPAALLDAEPVYKKFVQIEVLNSEQCILLLDTIARHTTPLMNEFLKQIFDVHLKEQLGLKKNTALFAAWLRACICLEKDPIQKFTELLNSKTDQNHCHERNKIELINAFVSCALATRGEKTWPKKLLQSLQEWMSSEENTLILGRWIRALGELELSELKWPEQLTEKVMKSVALQASALLMLESGEEHNNHQLLRLLQAEVSKNSEYRALFMRACSHLKTTEKDLPDEDLLQQTIESSDTEEVIAALSFVAAHPRSQYLGRIIELCSPQSSNQLVAVAAILAARALKSEKAVPALKSCLTSSSKVLAGRALDALLEIDHASARHTVIDFFIKHVADSFITDKVLRSMKAPLQGDLASAALLEEAIKHTANVNLKDDIHELASRLKSGVPSETEVLPGNDVIRALDKQLSVKILDYGKLADPIKASLRSAELPLIQPDLFEGTVDKSASVVQYCKAIDLALERDFGQKILFPKLEQQLHVFQNILHEAELDQDTPNISLVIKYLNADYLFSPHTFPASKMMMISKSILSGRILRERAQVIDGLKAWAVFLLLFSGRDRLWGAEQLKKDPLIFQSMAQKLAALQDLRNPAAHRQTMLALAPLSEIRKEVFNVFNSMKKAFE